MRSIGFSTGSLTKGDFRAALEMLEAVQIDAIELSALREIELFPLLQAFETLPLERYRHVSIHVPSCLSEMTDSQLCDALTTVASKGVPLIVHPDIISNWEAWDRLGEAVVIENMDKRKPCGRNASELQSIFEKLPQAKLCLDVGHSRQVDPSMHVTKEILRQHGARIAEIHLSEVNSASMHERLNGLAISAFREIAGKISDAVPIILESPLRSHELHEELDRAKSIFSTPVGAGTSTTSA